MWYYIDMDNMIKNITKQKQLLEIELHEYATRKKAGKPCIHPETYYAKLAHAYRGLLTAIRMLSTIDKDIYEKGKEYTKH